MGSHLKRTFLPSGASSFKPDTIFKCYDFLYVISHHLLLLLVVFTLVFKSVLMQVVRKKVYVFLSPFMGWEVLWASVPGSAAVPHSPPSPTGAENQGGTHYKVLFPGSHDALGRTPHSYLPENRAPQSRNIICRRTDT